jgi:hypothetical protein
MTGTPLSRPFHSFLSHSHEDAHWVERLAGRLADECRFRVWLDRWILVPGKSWQQAMARGLEEAATCAVCIGESTPQGWFQQEIERALDLQTRNPEFRVIPVLLPGASAEVIPGFLSLRTWADFRAGSDADYAFHVLKQGIRGEPVGRWPVNGASVLTDAIAKYEQKILELQRMRALGLHDEVVVEFERKILDRWLGDGGDT